MSQPTPAGICGGVRVVLLGPPGVGKGTQAVRLATAYGVPHISTGDMFRAAVAQGSPAGLAAKRYLDAGELVPDAVVTDMVRERLAQENGACGFVLDGFPRTRAQAEALDHILQERGEMLDAVLVLMAEEKVIVDRLSGRRLCRQCGSNYHLRYLPPRRDSVCDRCGGELYQREDDRPEAIRHRLAVYAEQTAELLDYYRAKGLLRSVRADADIESVARAIRALLAPQAERGQGSGA